MVRSRHVFEECLATSLVTILVAAAAICAAAAAAAQTADSGLLIAGRVLDDAGRPLEGASVTVAAEPNEFTSVSIVLGGDSRPEPVVETLTDEGGWFTLEAPGVGLWRVTVEARGFLPMRTSLLPLTDAVVLPPVSLVADAGMTVTVVGPGAVPIAGAQVWGVGQGRERWRAAARDGWRTTGRFALTDDSGRAYLPRAVGETFRLFAYAPGLVEAEPVVRDRARATVTLLPGVPFVVRFEDPRGRPLVGAAVRVGAGASPHAFIGKDGRVELAAVPGEPLAFEVATPEGQVESGRFEVTADEEIEVRTMRLPEPIVVTGRVVDQETRAAIADALVWNRADARHAVRTDRDGGYRMVLHETSVVRLEAAALGFDQGASEIRPTERGTVLAPTLVLAPALMVRGRVVDVDGRGVAGSRIDAVAERLSSVMSTSAAAPRRSVSLPGGSFRFSGLPPGYAWHLTARHEGFAPARAVAAEGSNVELVLGPPRSAFGVVVDAGGLPIAGADIAIAPRRDDDGAMWGMTIRGDGGESADALRAATDAEGRFRFDALAPGGYALLTRHAGYAHRIDGLVKVASDAAETDLGTVRLEDAAPIVGQVVDGSKAPVAGAQVYWSTEASLRLGSEVPLLGEMLGENRRLTAGTKGEFRIESVGRGERVDVTASAEGYADGEQHKATAPTQDLRIVLSPGATLAGVVVDSRGQGVPRARVSVRVSRGSSTKGHRSASTDFEGRFELTGVAAGTATVDAWATGQPPGRLANLEISPGDSLADLRIVLDAAATLTGEVADEQGRPMEGVLLFALPLESDTALQNHHASTDGDGRYRLSIQQPGRYRLHAQHSGHPPIEQAVEIEAGEQRLDLVLRTGRSIRGTVVDDRGAALAGAEVQLEGTIGGSFSPRKARTKDDGTFVLGGLEAGSYRVRASLDGWAPVHSRPVAVAAGERPFVELRLSRGATMVGHISGLDAAERGQLKIEVTNTATYAHRVAVIENEGEGFRLEHVAPGSWIVRGLVMGTARAAGERVEVLEGAHEVTADLDFGDGFALSGVVTSHGEPMAGASLSASGGVVGAQAVTDAAGRYRFEGLDPGELHLVVLDTESGLMVRRRLVLDGDLELDLELALSTITGLVTDVAGQPVAGAQVRLDPSPGTSRLRMPRSATTDAAGRFSVAISGVGSFTVNASRDGYAALRQRLEVVAGLPLDLELVLEPADRVRLAIQRADAGPVGDVTIHVLDAQGAMVVQSSVPVQGGYAEIDSVPPGTWRFAVSARGTAWTEVVASLPGDVPPVILASGATLELRVPDLLGLVSPARLFLRDALGNDLLPVIYRRPGAAGFEMWGGRASLTGLPAGTWIIEVVADDGRRWQTAANGVGSRLVEVVVE